MDLINTDYRILVHHSTYLDAVRDGHYDWIGAELIGEYELQRKNNEKAWRWDKLGVPVLTDANVFWNLAEYKYNALYESDIDSIDGVVERSEYL